ncbi:MAG: FkbM family methyltransferase [Oscillospiraceae bacterium]|nr:FkbM family methyltransferase [Oscillospiraceae bacterium]
MIRFIKSIPKKFEVLAPSVPVFGDDYFCRETLTKYENEISKVRDLLADNISVKVFENSILYRLTGRVEYLFDCETERHEVFENIIKLNSNETYVDLGAYRGDTIEEFLNLTDNSFSKILALEPDYKNYKKLNEFVESLDCSINSRIIIENKASWSEQKVLSFPKSGGRNSSLLLDNIDSVIFATDVDSLINSNNLSPTYIKMDVEGAEAETLLGLSKTLNKYKPKLAVSAYHKTGDLFSLPLLISKLNPNYKIYLRHHPYIPDWESNYYCI